MKSVLYAILMVFGFAGVAVACPDFSLSGPGGDISGSQMRSRVAYNVDAGGNNLIWNCPNVQPGTDRGAGYFTDRPDFTFNLRGMQGLQLVVSVISNCDSALLINTASANWYYDDDDNGNQDPRIVLTRPADGWLDIWVGTYDGSVCAAQLQMETFRR